MTQTMIAPVAQASTQQAQPVYEITELDKKRVQTIASAWKAYNGELEKPLIPMEGEADDNVMDNRCAPVVDRGIDFLFGLELEISVEEGAPTPAQEALDAAWGIKEQRIPLLQEWGMNGGVAGMGFLRAVPGDDDTFEIVNIDPSTVFVQTAPQDCKRPILFCIQYSVMEKINTRWQEVYYREEISGNFGRNDYGQPMRKASSWTMQHWTQVGQPGITPKMNNWQVAGPPIEWPYPFPPIFGNQNLPNPNSYWGKPDITPDLIGLNNSLNLVQSCINRILKLFGHPILYATGTAEQYINRKPGVIIGLGTAESKIAAVTFTSDVPNAIKFAESIRSDGDELTGVPGVATGRISTMPRGNLSGIAIELLFMPLLKKTQKKQCTYGGAIIDVSKALLVLNNMSGDIEIAIAWPSPIPHDDLPAIQGAISKGEIGISRTTRQRELGYDPEEEAEIAKSEVEMALGGGNMALDVIPPGIVGAPALPGQMYPKTATQPTGGTQP